MEQFFVKLLNYKNILKLIINNSVINQKNLWSHWSNLAVEAWKNPSSLLAKNFEA